MLNYSSERTCLKNERESFLLTCASFAEAFCSQPPALACVGSMGSLRTRARLFPFTRLDSCRVVDLQTLARDGFKSGNYGLDLVQFPLKYHKSVRNLFQSILEIKSSRFAFCARRFLDTIDVLRISQA